MKTEEIKHRHHLIPRHMGGDDSEDNLTPPISIDLHAAFHKQLWEDFGKKEDYIAWKCLSGRITPEQARLLAAKQGQEKSERYKTSRVQTGLILSSAATFESRSKGGKQASSSLVNWQQENKEKFLEQCKQNGTKTSQKQKIPHKYLGVIYESKKSLQKEHKMYNNKFYKLLEIGEIIRLDKLIGAY